MFNLDFKTIIRNQVAAIQALANVVLDFAIGSILRAIVESNSAIVMYLQAAILNLLLTTRAATSTGADLDSWMADFGVTRTPANSATGIVTFSRFTYTQSASVPVGSTVETADGSQVFTVIADISNQFYDVTTDSYILPIGTQQIDIPVMAIAPGVAAGNVIIGAINIISQSISGIDYVNNNTAITNGIDSESDSDFRARFIQFIASLSKGTKGAVGYAILSLQQGLNYTLTENYDYDGTLDRGFFYVVVDDGTGDPATDLLDSITAAIELVRPLCSQFLVYAPIITGASVAMTISVVTGFDENDVKQVVNDALTNYINSLKIGETLQYSKLIQIAYEASPGVLNVAGTALNAGTADIDADDKHIIKTILVMVN